MSELKEEILEALTILEQGMEEIDMYGFEWVYDTIRRKLDELEGTESLALATKDRNPLG